MKQSTQALLAALSTVLLWASAFPLIRIGLRAFEPVPLAALRFAIAALLMLAWLAWRSPRLPPAKDLLRLLLCALVGIAGYNMLLNTGQQTVTAGAASFIINTAPALTALLAVAFLKERFRRWAWVGTAVSLAGVLVIASGQPGGLSFGQGAMLVLGAAACQAAFFTLQRPLVAAYGAKVCAAIVMVLGALCLTPWLPSALAQAAAAPAGSLWAVLYLGVFPAAIGYATWGVAQAHFGASRAANFLYLVPPVATALGLLLAAEMPRWDTLLGGALAIAGVVLVNTRGRA
jgi:drug/metabolite transporter (DMT)-like permease